MSVPWILYPCLFLIALLYASVGLGGASGYLAIFSLLGITDPRLAPTVLLFNILVAALSFQAYYREGHFERSLLLPFVLTSIPASFAGGMIPLSERVFSTLLGVVLLLAGVRLLLSGDESSSKRSHRSWTVSVFVGLLVGLLAGLTGSGGGFILIPVLLVYFGIGPKKAAAVASAFVVLNSLTGFTGHLVRAHYPLPGTVSFLAIAGVGGLIGARLGARILDPVIVRRLISLVLFFAGLRLVLPDLF